MASDERGVARTPIEVRRATEVDIDAVMRIEQEEPLAPHWTRQAYEEMLNRAGGPVERCLLVAEDENGLIGFTAGSWVDGDEAAELESIVVHAPWRRRRVARALCAGLSEWATACGASGLKLEVRATSEGAIRLYTGSGFVECGRREKYYREPEDDAVVMVLRLQKANGTAGL